MSDDLSPPPPAASVSPPPPEERERAGRFIAELHQLTPRTHVTFALLAANILVYVVMVATGVDWYSPDSITLVHWGADYGPRTTNGEWWRLLTSMFLHGGIIHIAANMWALYNVGVFYEKLVGHAGLAVMYFVTGLVGSAASVWWHPDATSVGASGAVFGLFGALLGYLVRERATVPPLVLRPLMRSVMVIIAINVFIGFSIPFIDNAAHLGGLITGCVLGMIIARPISPTASRQRMHAATSTGILGGALVLGLTALVPRMADLDAMFATISHADEAAQTRYAEATNQRTQGTLSDADYVRIIESEILPPWRTAQAALTASGNIPAQMQPRIDLLRDYVAARRDFYELRAEGIKTSDAALLRRANERARQAAVDLDRLK